MGVGARATATSPGHTGPLRAGPPPRNRGRKRPHPDLSFKPQAAGETTVRLSWKGPGTLSITLTSWLKALTASMFALRRRRLLRARRSHKTSRRGGELGNRPGLEGRRTQRAAEPEAGQEEAAAEAAGQAAEAEEAEGGGPSQSRSEDEEKERRRRRWAPACPFGGSCALRLADTAPRALTHWPTLARPASGRSLSSASRQRDGNGDESTPRRAHWDSSGLPALPVPGSRPAPPRPRRPRPRARPAPRACAPPAQPLARDARNAEPFPACCRLRPETAGTYTGSPRGALEECGEISGPGSWHGEGPRIRAPLPDAALPGTFLCAILPRQAPHPRGLGAAYPLPPGTKGSRFFNLSPLGVHLRAPRAASADAVPVCPDGAG